MPFKINRMVPAEKHVWDIGGLGYGPNDLTDYTPITENLKDQYV
jgi:hypothetical protein